MAWDLKFFLRYSFSSKNKCGFALLLLRWFWSGLKIGTEAEWFLVHTYMGPRNMVCYCLLLAMSAYFLHNTWDWRHNTATLLCLFIAARPMPLLWFEYHTFIIVTLKAHNDVVQHGGQTKFQQKNSKSKKIRDFLLTFLLSSGGPHWIWRLFCRKSVQNINILIYLRRFNFHYNLLGHPVY